MVKREIGFFVINGLVSVAIAYCVYLALADYGMQLYAANGMAYVSGLVYGFFANRSLTFRNNGKIRFSNVLFYCILYSATMLINMATIFLMLDLLADFSFKNQLAFFVAISLSTLLNFLGMKYFVFSKKINRMGFLL